MQNASCFLPSIISYNAKAINASSTDIIERINWLNNQQPEKTVNINTDNIINKFSKLSLDKAQIPTVSIS